MTFRELLSAPTTTLADLQSHLGSLDGARRIEESRALGPKQLARLYEVAGTGKPLDPDHMVERVKDGETAHWYGRNSLPAFRLFEKRFIRHDGGVYGFNWNPAIVTAVSGPGYFFCRVDETKPNELLIDYTKTPSAAPASDWPAVKSNASGLSRFVYKDMYDYCRRVTDDVVIGAATRLGKPIGQYFVLCRG
jgi:hypothetical protein